MNIIGNANKKATKALEIAWDGELPVDLERISRNIRLLRTHGDEQTTHKIRVEPKGLGTESGYAEMLTNEPGKPFLCAYNKDEIPYRQRFTIAHELGHVLLGHVKEGSSPKRDTTFKTDGDLQEMGANAFAAALLMPAKEVRRLARQGRGVSELAEIFDVSPTAMKYRLQNLGLL